MRSTCKPYRKQLVLYHYDELSAKERLQLNAHLSVCKSCQAELQRIQNITGQINLPDPDEQALQSGRQLLFHRLRSGRSPARHTPHPGVRLALQTAMAIVLVGFGFWVGQRHTPVRQSVDMACRRLLTAEQTVNVDNAQVSPFLMSIDNINLDAQTGRVDVAYHTINEIRMTGRPENPQLQRILYHALLTHDDMALRLRTAKALQGVAAELQRLDAPLISALEQQLYREQNLGVKLAMLDVVDTLPRDEKTQTILVNVMLYDKQTAVRIHAFKSLIRNADMDTAIRNLLIRSASDSNTYIRTKSVELLDQSNETLRKEQSL